MAVEPIPPEPKNIERRREILYGTPGVTIYQNGQRVLWIPDNFGKLTGNLPSRQLETLFSELKNYLGISASNNKDNQKEPHQ